MPLCGAADTLREVSRRLVELSKQNRPIILGYGAHLVKMGLSPLVADLINCGVITGVITNGASPIHELEFIIAGKTSEDVDSRLRAGTFGMAKQTADAYNAAVQYADTGLGQSLGEIINHLDPSMGPQTILGACAFKEKFAGVFSAIGTDIVHMHPSCHPAALGAASHRDFRTLCSVISDMGDGGAYINMGSAVILPEVFLKAVSVAINTGTNLDKIMTVNMDQILHYRPDVNVVRRPPGKGYHLIGHHEIMLPLLRYAILELLCGV